MCIFLKGAETEPVIFLQLHKMRLNMLILCNCIKPVLLAIYEKSDRKAFARRPVNAFFTEKAGSSAFRLFHIFEIAAFVIALDYQSEIIVSRLLAHGAVKGKSVCIFRFVQAYAVDGE